MTTINYYGMKIDKKCKCGINHNFIPVDAKEWNDGVKVIGFIWDCECKSTLFWPTREMKAKLEAIKEEKAVKVEKVKEPVLAKEVEDELKRIWKKALIVTFFVFGFGLQASAQLAGSTLHKTADGKYPHYYIEKAGDTPWNDDDQKQYDAAMDEAIRNMCVHTNTVKRLQDQLNEEKEVGQNTGYVDKQKIHDAGLRLVQLKKEMEPTAKIIKDETGKDVSQYSCEDYL